MPDPLSLALSIAALVVSIASAVAASLISRRQNALQERMLALETAREESRLRQARSADVKAAVLKFGREVKLVVANEGPVSAKNLRLFLDGKPMLEHRLILRGEEEITMLGPGVQASYILAVTMGSGRLLDVKIVWDDESGEPRKWESQLKVI